MYNLWEELFPLKILVVTENFPLQIFVKESKALDLIRVDYWYTVVLVVWTSREQVCSLLMETTVETVEMKGLLRRRSFLHWFTLENYSWIFDHKWIVSAGVPISYFALWDRQAFKQYFIPGAVVLISPIPGTSERWLLLHLFLHKQN